MSTREETHNENETLHCLYWIMGRVSRCWEYCIRASDNVFHQQHKTSFYLSGLVTLLFSMDFALILTLIDFLKFHDRFIVIIAGFNLSVASYLRFDLDLTMLLGQTP